jgi:drug/metabolite transporter (DMT)-like permease
MQDSDTIPARIAALQVFLCMIWGLGQIVTKIGNAGISPIYHSGLRSAGAGVLVLAWMALRRRPLRVDDGTLGVGVLIGLLFGFEFICLYIGLNHTSAARATVLLYTAPFFVAIGAHLFVPNDRLSVRKGLGLLAAFAGVVAAFYDGTSHPGASGWLGDMLCLAAGFFWAATTVVVKATRLRSVPPDKTLLYQLVVSAVLLLGVAWAIDEPGLFAPTPTVLAALAYQVFVVASASYLTWFWLVSRFRASALSTFTFLTPMFGVLLAWLLLDEPIRAGLLVSVALIASGIVLVNRG